MGCSHSAEAVGGPPTSATLRGRNAAPEAATAAAAPRRPASGASLLDLAANNTDARNRSFGQSGGDDDDDDDSAVPMAPLDRRASEVGGGGDAMPRRTTAHSGRGGRGRYAASDAAWGVPSSTVGQYTSHQPSVTTTPTHAATMTTPTTAEVGAAGMGVSLVGSPDTIHAASTRSTNPLLAQSVFNASASHNTTDAPPVPLDPPAPLIAANLKAHTNAENAALIALTKAGGPAVAGRPRTWLELVGMWVDALPATGEAAVAGDFPTPSGLVGEPAAESPGPPGRGPWQPVQ